MAKLRKRLTNTTEPARVKTITQEELSTAPLFFDFRYDFLKCESIKKFGFTNLLKDEKEFAKMSFELYSKTIPTIQKAWDARKMGQKDYFPHTHEISRNMISTVMEIANKLHGAEIVDKYSSLWQIGTNQSIRLICIRIDNIMYPLFVDYHHQLYPNIKHNQKDLSKYNFCPYEKYA